MDKTERGYPYFCFEDEYGQKCSLQTSLAEKNCIWFGVENTGPNLTDDQGDYNAEVHIKMHLNINMVKNILPILQKFVETGEIE